MAGYYTNSNPLNFSSSGNVENTGTALQNQVNSIKNGTGVFLQNSNLNGLISTGSADLRYLFTGSSGAFYASSNPNNFIKSGDVDTKLIGLISTGQGDLRYLQTGVSGEFYKTSNPAGYITTTNLNGLISTGSADLRYLPSGASGQFYLKSNPNNWSHSGNVENTGTALIGLINTERNKNSVTGINSMALIPRLTK